jgi:hypothetical protein
LSAVQKLVELQGVQGVTDMNKVEYVCVCEREIEIYEFHLTL